MNQRPILHSRRSRVERQAQHDAERMIRSQIHLALDRIIDANIEAIVHHCAKGRQIGVVLNVVNADGSPFVPESAQEAAAQPTKPSRVKRLSDLFRRKKISPE